MRYFRLFENGEKRYYDGPPLETGETAQHFSNASPGVSNLIQKLKDKGTVLDFGAGHGRNSRYLRELGFECYGYDPFNGEDSDGWTGVSRNLPEHKFDAAFTSYVLNVVPFYTQMEILRGIEHLADYKFHVVRNLDVLATLKTAKNTEIFQEYARKEFEGRQMTDMEIAIYGFLTRVKGKVGFQRILEDGPMLDAGYTLIRKASGFKLYEKIS